MTSVGFPVGKVRLGLLSRNARTPHQGRLGQHQTTVFERLLLMAAIIVVPMQWYYPTIMGASLGFIVFAGTAAYVAVWRLKALRRTCLHPVFLAGYALVGIGLFMEIAHDSTGYPEILRIFFMILGGTIVASLCRDRRALLWAIYAVLLASVLMSGILFLDVYGQLSEAKASDFTDASHLRESVFDSIDGAATDANSLAFFAAWGVIVALVLGLTTRSLYQRCVFLVLGAFCLVATFLPMSRGGVVIVAVSCAAVLYAYGIMQPNVVIAAGVLAVGMLVWVPDVVFNRLTLSVEATGLVHKQEGRERVYGEVIKYFPEYILTGVGISHFYGVWGRKTRLWMHKKVLGTHNCFAQVAVYWGLAGLFALIALFWQAYRCCPKRFGVEPLRLCLLGISVSMMIRAMFIHQLYDKGFSLTFGLLVGASFWVFSKGSGQRQHRNSAGSVLAPSHEPRLALGNPPASRKGTNDKHRMSAFLARSRA